LAAKAIRVYRARHPKVLLMWRECDVMLHALASPTSKRKWLNGAVTTEGNAIILPNGLKLHYNLQYDSVTDRFLRDGKPSNLWGGALTGEIIQALAACYFREVLLKIKATTGGEASHGLMPVCLRHDEAVYCVPEADVATAVEAVDAAFCEAPAWLAGIPLKCEIFQSKTYTKEKE
jgi:hypothetical protein